MELSTTARGKAKLLWNGYTKHTEKNDMIRWCCTCRASKHCPASAYTDLLPAYPVLKTDHNHYPEPMMLEVDRCLTEMRIRAALSNDPAARIYADNITALTGAAKAILPSVDTCKFKKICLYRIFIGFAKMPCYQNVCYQDVLLPKCPITEMSSYRNVQLPKCPVIEMSVTKTSITKVSFTEMSGYHSSLVTQSEIPTRSVQTFQKHYLGLFCIKCAEMVM